MVALLQMPSADGAVEIGQAAARTFRMTSASFLGCEAGEGAPEVLSTSDLVYLGRWPRIVSVLDSCSFIYQGDSLETSSF